MSSTGSIQGNTSPSGLSLNRGLLVVAILAALPIALLYLTRMWIEGHYQFFPLYIAVVGYLYFDRFQEITDGTKPGNGLFSVVLLAICSMLILSAVILESAFLGAVSLYALFGSIIYWFLGVGGLRNSAPFLLLLLLAIPLPANIDNLIIVKLQFLASQFAGSILDLFGLIHFREGVILITQQQQFFTEEACSGIRSLYSSIAGMAGYCVICRYGWLRSLFTIVQTFMWVIFGNALRIAIVVWVASYYTTSIAEGLMHDLLGLVIFVVIMLLAISTDKLISSMMPDVVEEEVDDSIIEAKPVVTSAKIWSRLATGVLALLPAILFLIVFGIGCRMMYIGFSQDESLISILDRRLPMMTEEEMPEFIGDWKRENYERIRRGHSTIFAQDSFAWRYSHEKKGLSVLLSVDCPWHEFHDLVICYEVKGWRGNNVEVPKNASMVYKSVELSRFEGAEAYLFYAGFDRNATNVPPPSRTDTFDAPTRLLSGIRQLAGMNYLEQIEASNFQLPMTMIQAYCEPSTVSTPELKKDVQMFFEQAIGSVIQSPRFKKD